jgi:hypothetical protein
LNPEAIDRLTESLRAQLSGRVRDLRLSAQGDVLVLRGRAGSYYAKQLAQELIRRATAVLLINEIDVYESSDPWGFAAGEIGGVQERHRRDTVRRID